MSLMRTPYEHLKQALSTIAHSEPPYDAGELTGKATTVEEAVAAFNALPANGSFSLRAEAAGEGFAVEVTATTQDGQNLVLAQEEFTTHPLSRYRQWVDNFPRRGYHRRFEHDCHELPLTPGAQRNLRNLLEASAATIGVSAEFIPGRTVTFPSGKILATDPCYRLDGAINLIGINPDTAFTPYMVVEPTDFDERVVALILWEEGAPLNLAAFNHKYPFTVDVDSASAGFVDFAAKQLIEEEGEHDAFFDSARTYRSYDPRIISREEWERLGEAARQKGSAQLNSNLLMAQTYAQDPDRNVQALLTLFGRLKGRGFLQEWPLFLEYDLPRASTDVPLGEEEYILADSLYGEAEGRGVFASSGFGDGSYDCFAAKEGERTFGLMLLFCWSDEVCVGSVFADWAE